MLQRNMSYHADLAPRRSPWLIAMPLMLVHRARGRRGAACGIYAAGEAETRVDAWRAAAGQGRARLHLRQPGGRRLSVPHRGALHRRRAPSCSDTQPPIAIKLKQILVVAQVWDTEAPDRRIHRAARPRPIRASRPISTADWTLAQASVRGTPAEPERASIAIDGLKLEARARHAR